MVFCGKCGFQLTSENITCPRCGTPTEAGLNLEESQSDSPTIASSQTLGINQSFPGTQETFSPSRPVEPRPLILGSHPYDYGTPEQMSNEATSMIDSQIAGPGQVSTGAAYPGYVPESAANYPHQRAPYPGYSMQGGTTYQQFGVPLEDAEKVRARGRIVGLLLILIGLLFILGAMVLFIFTFHSSTSASPSIQQALAAFALLCPPTYL